MARQLALLGCNVVAIAFGLFLLLLPLIAILLGWFYK